MNFEAQHQNKIRIYAEDVDFMGIVYHANYLHFFERSRTEFLRKNNVFLSELIKQDILFAIKELTIKYVSPARLDDLLTINTQAKKLGVCGFAFEQVVVDQNDKLIAEANIEVVCVNEKLKPRRVPEF